MVSDVRKELIESSLTMMNKGDASPSKHYTHPNAV